MAKRRKSGESRDPPGGFFARLRGRTVDPQQRPDPSTLMGNERGFLSGQTTGVTTAPSYENDTSIAAREVEGWQIAHMRHRSDSGLGLGDFLHHTAYGGGSAGAQAGSTSVATAAPTSVPGSTGVRNPVIVESPPSNADSGDSTQSAQTGQAESSEGSTAQGRILSGGRTVRFSTTNAVITSDTIDARIEASQGVSETMRESPRPTSEPSDELPLGGQGPGHTGMGQSEVPPEQPGDHDAGEMPSGTGAHQQGQEHSQEGGPSGQSSASQQQGEGEPSGEGGQDGERQRDDDPRQLGQEGSSQQPPPWRYPLYHTQVISNQAHPSPLLKGTRRAHTTLAYTTAGVTARIWISKDDVPFVFPVCGLSSTLVLTAHNNRTRHCRVSKIYDIRKTWIGRSCR